MSITASLTDFSLPEVFQFIEKGKKTGLLAFDTTPPHYIWAQQGRVVGATNRKDHQGLVALIEQYHWVSERVFDKLVYWCCPIDEPLGTCLKNQGVLQASQLKQLFHRQIAQSVSTLLQLKECQFKFHSQAVIPAREMTGLSVLATEAISIGLKALTTLTDKGIGCPQTGNNGCNNHYLYEARVHQLLESI